MKAAIQNYRFLIIGCLFVQSLLYGQPNKHEAEDKFHLIAHRGGVVDNRTAENSLASLKKASKKGYWMVEVDLRLTRDSILIIHHDSNFKRYYGVNKTVSEMDWKDAKELKGDLGNRVLSFEETLKICQENDLQVMVDNKIKGYDIDLFGEVVGLLKKYGRLEHAMMIGTDESTAYFTGKVKLSCTRQQLQDNMLRPGFNSKDYYLFSKSISKEDVEWARRHGVMAVGVINSWALKADNVMEEAAKEAKKLKEAGVGYYQIDSIFGSLFR